MFVLVSDVEPGANWLRSAARALDRADAMILVISAESSGSPELRKAFEFAITNQRFENRVVTVACARTGAVPVSMDPARPTVRQRSSGSATRGQEDH